MKRYCALMLLLFLIKPIYGQEGAIPSLEIQQSPLLFGAGWIGAAIPMKNADGFYYNPAQLGYFSKENNFSVFFMPQKTVWGPNFRSDLTFNSFSAAVGYNFNKDNNGIPLSIGIGYMHNKIDYGMFVITNPNDPSPIGLYNSFDSFNCFSVGASYDYYLLFNLGMSIKSFDSKLSDKFERTGMAYDFGAMITAPISKLFFNDYKVNLDEKSFLKPNFDFTLGYSLTNLGKKISYADPAQADPLPRTARLGYTFDFGIELSTSWAKNLKAFDYSFTVEAEDILITYDSAGHSSYQNAFGDINIGKNLINVKADQSVIVHRGHIFRFFDTLILTTGRREGKFLASESRASNGLGISTDGLFKVLNAAVDSPVINYITSHFTLEYYDTNIFTSSFLETNLKGLVLNYKGLAF